MALSEHPVNPLSEQTIGAAIEVHRLLGPGLLESSYQFALCYELELRHIDFRSHVPIALRYKERQHPHAFVADIVIEKRLIVEVKSLDTLKPVHGNQLLTYMRLSGISAGLIINFNVPRLTSGIVRRLL